MSTHKVTMIPGDGIGPEISEAMRMVVESTGIERMVDDETAESIKRITNA